MESGKYLIYLYYFAAGVIDIDYRGNVGVVIFNHGDNDFVINEGDRIAQLICEKIEYPDLQEVQVRNNPFILEHCFSTFQNPLKSIHTIISNFIQDKTYIQQFYKSLLNLILLLTFLFRIWIKQYEAVEVSGQLELVKFVCFLVFIYIIMFLTVCTKHFVSLSIYFVFFDVITFTKYILLLLW